jgi:hypothetical protein
MTMRSSVLGRWLGKGVKDVRCASPRDIRGSWSDGPRPMNSLVGRLIQAPGVAVSTLRKSRQLRSVPVAVLGGTETIHLGGGELVPCPGADTLPLVPAAKGLGLGSTSLALPSAKVHVLRDAVLCPGSRVVRTSDGRIVSESITGDMLGRLDLDAEDGRPDPLELPGTIALYRSPRRSLFHTLIDHVPRAALLSQPVMRRLGPITLVHDGELTPMEQVLLPRLLGSQVVLRQVNPMRRVTAERILLPGYVTRPGAGAIPSWYRRWVDRTAAELSTNGDPLPRRVHIERSAGVVDPAGLRAVLQEHGIVSLDLSRMPAEDQIRCFRNAELVVGVTGGGLAGVLFSRSAHVVELSPSRYLLPHYFYLCAAKGLPHDHVLATAGAPLTDIDRLRERPVQVDLEALDRRLRSTRRPTV